MSRFVSANTKEGNVVEQDEEWARVRRELEDGRIRKEGIGAQESSKSLYEVLQANKATKQEAFEESMKLKNQFRALDDDEIDFLDSVLEKDRKREAAILQETAKELEDFRQKQSTAERVATDASGPTAVQDSGPGSWATKGKRKRKAQGAREAAGLKIRKQSRASLAKDEKEDTVRDLPIEEDHKHSMAEQHADSAVVSGKEGTNAKDLPKPSQLLAGYSSDEEA